MYCTLKVTVLSEMLSKGQLLISLFTSTYAYIVMFIQQIQCLFIANKLEDICTMFNV